MSYNKGDVSKIDDFSLPPWERGVRQGGLMNKVVVKQNALDFKAIMDKHSIRCPIIYGTLLGAMREGDVISNDSDFDVFCFSSDYLRWPSARRELINIGFTIPDIKPLHDDYLIRNGEKIDINWIVPWGKFYLYEEYSYYPKEYFDNLDEIMLFGIKWQAPHNRLQLIKELYGDDWRTPSAGKKGRRYIYQV